MTDFADRFALCLHATLAWEGPGYEEDPRDPGGPTCQGIILEEFAAWFHQEVTPATLADLKERLRTMDDATRDAIYYHNYWVATRASELPPGIDQIVFDAAVNVGVSKAIRWLQKCVGSAEDGHLGVQTMAAVHRASAVNVVSEYSKLRVAYYRSRKGFKDFGNGWLNRTESIRRQADATLHGGGSMGMALGLANIANDATITPQKTAKAIPDPPTTTPVQSTTVWASATNLMMNFVGMVTAMSALMGALVQAGKSAGDLHVAATTSPMQFLSVVCTVVGVGTAAYTWRERIRKMVQA